MRKRAAVSCSPRMAIGNPPPPPASGAERKNAPEELRGADSVDAVRCAAQKFSSFACAAPDTLSAMKTMMPSAGELASSALLTLKLAVPAPLTETVGAAPKLMAGEKALKLPIPGI